MPTLSQVLAAFPRTPINIEIKGRTKAEADAEYVPNAEVLAALLRKSTARRDLIVVSFKQQAVDRFHALAPAIPVAPGVDGAAAFLLRAAARPATASSRSSSRSPTSSAAQKLDVTNAGERRQGARATGYAWHTWLSDDGESPATWRQLIDWCVDGVMTARPVAFERVLRAHPAPEACR